MEKKKLKLKSPKKIKETIANDFDEKKKTKKRKVKKKHRATHTFLVIIMAFGIFCASSVVAFALYIVFTAPEFTVEKLYNKKSSFKKL